MNLPLSQTRDSEGHKEWPKLRAGMRAAITAGAFSGDLCQKQGDKKLFSKIFCFPGETAAFPGYHQGFYFLLLFSSARLDELSTSAACAAVLSGSFDLQHSSYPEGTQ